jgi:hypothetical protein
VVEGLYHLSQSGGGAVLAAYVSVGTSSLECSVLKCGQVYSTLCCLLVGTSHSDCITYCTVIVFLIMSCIVHIAIVIWCHALVSVGNVSARGVALDVTTASVQLRVLHNSAYLSARLSYEALTVHTSSGVSAGLVLGVHLDL